MHSMQLSRKIAGRNEIQTQYKLYPQIRLGPCLHIKDHPSSLVCHTQTPLLCHIHLAAETASPGMSIKLHCVVREPFEKQKRRLPGLNRILRKNATR
jgi:hypothetical protein